MFFCKVDCILVCMHWKRMLCEAFSSRAFTVTDRLWLTSIHCWGFQVEFLTCHLKWLRLDILDMDGDGSRFWRHLATLWHTVNRKSVCLYNTTTFVHQNSFKNALVSRSIDEHWNIFDQKCHAYYEQRKNVTQCKIITLPASIHESQATCMPCKAPQNNDPKLKRDLWATKCIDTVSS